MVGARENNLDENLQNVTPSSSFPLGGLFILGPEGGDGGGTIVTEGTPEQVARCEQSWTGKFLRDML